MATSQIAHDHDTVQVEIFIAAPPARVFQSITDPAQTTQWWGQKGMYRLTKSHADVRQGDNLVDPLRFEVGHCLASGLNVVHKRGARPWAGDRWSLLGGEPKDADFLAADLLDDPGLVEAIDRR